MVQLTTEVEWPTTVAKVNKLYAEAAARAELSGILAYTEEPFVSSDGVKSPYSCVFDAGLTIGAGGTQVFGRRLVRQRMGIRDETRRIAERVVVPVPVPA
jgi:glyceraldehyde-3-phosphate dehydrogenase/erythrose-4-phosphate dehydrogenase